MDKFYWFITVLIFLQSSCTVHASSENDKLRKRSECISQYTDLEDHILSNRYLLEQLINTFYRSGKHVSKFVYITYNAPFGMSSNESYNTTDLLIADNNCTNHQAVYIWSESPLYLLGPKPLFWFTLFAINVPETSVTIESPCLCTDEYYKLLSRLTYLVSSIKTHLSNIIFFCIDQSLFS